MTIEPIPTAKPWYTSKTLYFNLVIAAVTAVITAFSNDPTVPVTVSSVVGVVGNLILRLVTKQPVSL